MTVTPAEKAECPKENPAFMADFRIPEGNKCPQSNDCYFYGTGEDIQNFLNKGGTIPEVEKRLEEANVYNKASYFYGDITNDSVPEFIFHDFGIFTHVSILTCKEGLYELFYPLADPPSYLQSIDDLNKNGMPEIMVSSGYCSGSGCIGINILEWDGNKYIDISENIYILGPTKRTEMKDIKGNGIKEIILVGDRPGSCCELDMIPWRVMTKIYSWNGKAYSESYLSFEQPKCRFQAIQDGDRETNYGKYTAALSLYQDAIFSDKLDGGQKNERNMRLISFTKIFSMALRLHQH